MARQFKPGQLQTGSLFNISSSYALTASFALNGGGGGGSSFPHTGSAIISGSLVVTGLTTISGSAANLFLIKNASNQAVLTVSQSGVVILATSSIELTGPAPNGAIYFTSNSLFVGLN